MALAVATQIQSIIKTSEETKTQINENMKKWKQEEIRKSSP